MKKQKKKSYKSSYLIPVNSFRKKHPILSGAFPTDLYYTRIANTIFKMLSDGIGHEGITREQIEQVSLNIAAYFEDVISGIGQWQAYVDTCKKRYGKYLPFYQLSDEYCLYDINPEDIQFIFWLTMWSLRENKLPNPENPWIAKMSYRIYDFLFDEYEIAPENDLMKEMIYDTILESDFVNTKALLMWLAENSFIYGCSESFKNQVKDLEEKYQELMPSMDDKMSHYSALSFCAIEFPIGPLAQHSMEVLCEMCRHQDIPEEIINNIAGIRVMRPMSYYINKVEKDSEAITEGQDGKTYHIALNSFSQPNFCKEGAIMIGTIAFYEGLWHICGFSSFYDDDKISDATKQFKALQREYLEEIENPEVTLYNDAALVEKAIKANNGDRLFFFKSNKELQKWQKEIFGAEISSRQDEFSDHFANGAMLFFTEDNRIMISNSFDGVKHPSNMLYNPATASSEALSMICSSNAICSELAEYLINNNLVPDAAINSLKGPEYGRQLVQDNIKFLATCLRGELIK